MSKTHGRNVSQWLHDENNFYFHQLFGLNIQIIPNEHCDDVEHFEKSPKTSTIL